jgi:hypothetical protein
MVVLALGYSEVWQVWQCLVADSVCRRVSNDPLGVRDFRICSDSGECHRLYGLNRAKTEYGILGG